MHITIAAAARSPGRWLPLFAIVVTSWTLGTGTASAQFVTFGFAPPDQLRFEETHTFKKEILVGLDEPETEIQSSRLRYDLRKTANGYAIVATPLQDEPLSESGANLMNALASQAPITYDLDSRGQLTGVRDAQRALNALRESLSPSMVDALFTAIGASTQSPNELAANLWNSRMMLGQFVGRRVQLDTLFTTAGDFPLPFGGTARGSVEIFMQEAECLTGSCVEVYTTYVSNDQTVAARFGSTLRRLLVGSGQSFKELIEANDDLRRALEEESGGTLDLNVDIAALVPHFQVSDALFKSQNLRLIDPSTGLLHSEIQVQTIEAQLGVGGEPATTFVLKQTHSYDLTYPNQDR